MGLFRRKRSEPSTPEEMLERARSEEAVRRLGTDLISSDFAFTVEDVFAITGRGVVLTGRVERGSIRTGATAHLARDGTRLRAVTVTGIESRRRRESHAGAGDEVGLLLRDVERSEVAAGDTLGA